MTHRTCPECGGRVVGRSDKRFCSDACRGAFHYRGHAAHYRPIKRIQYRLRRNHEVLRRCAEAGERTWRLDELSGAGIDLRYHTHRVETRDGPVLFCYDHGVCIDGDVARIIRSEQGGAEP